MFADSDLNCRPERGIWTDIFAVVPSHQLSRQFCYNWIRTELRLPPVPTDDTPPCPCTLQQALMDTVRYQPDPDCNSVTRSREADLNCLYRANAQHCVRLSDPGWVSLADPAVASALDLNKYLTNFSKI